jgi:hypothetical protein
MMKSIFSFALICSIFAAWACNIQDMVTLTPQEAVSKEYAKNVVTVVKTNGEKIEFHRERPARIEENEVVGWSGRSMTTKIPESEIIKIPSGAYPKVITTKNQGDLLALMLQKKEDATLVFQTLSTIRIPLSEIDHLSMKEDDASTSFLTILLLVPIIVVLIGAFGWARGGGFSGSWF